MRSADEVAAMACPVCRTGLHLSERGGVEIDYCPTCRGVWLDRGELDKIIERTAAPAPREPGRERSAMGRGGLMGMAASMIGGLDDDRRRPHGDDHYHGHKKYKKKSRLSDFFD